MSDLSPQGPLFETFIQKATLKQKVYENTLTTFNLFKEAVKKTAANFHKQIKNTEASIPFEYKVKGDFEIELKFAGDTLIFLMHTNVFEFPRHHEVMNTSYVKENKQRSYCGIINIYNFLSDSFKYKRVNDIGYLIGRVFVNKDMHYFVEGKREIGLLYNNFNTATINRKTAREIVESAIRFTINFDLFTPPYDTLKEVSVYDIQSTLDNITLKTGKRLGFQFQADIDDE